MGKSSSCLRKLGGKRSQEVRFHRFLHNERVTHSEMLATATEHTARAVRGRHVLAIQDTTELNFSHHEKSKRDFGVVGNGRDLGVFLHPVIVADAGQREARSVGHAGGLIGLADANFYIRQKKAKKRRKKRKGSRRRGKPLRDRTRPIAERETRRWVNGVEAAGRVLQEAAMVTVIADRESDIYDVFAAPRPAHVHVLVRAMHDRALADGTRLFAGMASRAHVEGPKIRIPAKPGRAAREAATRIAWAEVEIERPRRTYAAKELPEKLMLRALHVEEVDPPEGAEPVTWLLLTTHEIAGLDEAIEIVGWYRARWIVEQIFRTLKTQGFNLEESQIETRAVLEKLATAVLIAALRTMQLVQAREGDTGQALSDAIGAEDEPLVEALVSELEGKTEKLKCPHSRGNLARLTWVVARLGGWSGYKSKGYKPPGPKTIAYGLERFDAVKQGWRLSRNV
jgi:Transposase DDE domain